MATKERTPSVQVVDDLIARPEFKTAVFSMAQPKNKQDAARKALEKTEAYKKFMQAQTPQRAASIAAVGLIPFLASEDEE
jgi:hypothetical protein